MAERLLSLDELLQAVKDHGLGNVQEIGDDSEFQRQLDSAGDKLVVVDFSTTWCFPSVMMEPVIADLSEKYTDVVFLKVDADECRQTAEMLEIVAYPTFVFFKDKQELKRIRGAPPRLELELCVTGVSEFPDSRITPKALQHLESAAKVNIKEELAPIWLDIAMHIKMDTEALDAITSQYTEPADCSHAMLSVWLDPEMDVPKPPTWRVLLDFLKANGKGELATKIEQYRESEPSVFHEIPEYISKQALESLTKGKQAMACPMEPQSVIDEKEREIASLKVEISRLKARLSAASQAVPKREVEKMIKKKDDVITTLKKEVSKLQAELLLASVPAGPTEAPSTPGVCDIPGVQPVGSVRYTVSGDKHQVYKWNGYGVRLRLPQGAVPPNAPPTELQITASLTGQYEFPENCKLVSGIYCISFPVELQKPVTLDIEHSLDLTRSSQCSSLSFVYAKTSEGELPYRFELVEGGTFTPRCQFGSIKTTHFSHWAIVWLYNLLTGQASDSGQPSPTSPAPMMEPDRKYIAQLFYRGDQGVYNWMLHFVIIPNLELSKTAIEQEYKDAKTGTDLQVIYEDDKIVLGIPKEGEKVGNWSLLPTGYPMVTREEANKYTSQMPAVPKCQIRLKWLDKQTNPEELIYCLNLIGAQKPRNYINITFEPDLDPGLGHNSSDVTDQTSRECVAICKMSADLNTALSSFVSVEYIADKLVAADIISRHVRQDLNALGLTSYQKACRLTEAMLTKVKIMPKNFYTIIGIMREEGALKETVEKLMQLYKATQVYSPHERSRTDQDGTGFFDERQISDQPTHSTSTVVRKKRCSSR